MTHLFFHCSFAFVRAVWSSSETPLCTSLLPFEQDGIQKSLAAIINKTTADRGATANHPNSLVHHSWYQSLAAIINKTTADEEPSC